MRTGLCIAVVFSAAWLASCSDARSRDKETCGYFQDIHSETCILQSLDELLDTCSLPETCKLPSRTDPDEFVDGICASIEALDSQIKIHEDNIANVNTVGYKRRTESGSRDMSQGDFEYTERELDWGIDGTGFFQVQLPDNRIAYTRDGAFHIDDSGRIVNATGYPVMGLDAVPEQALSITIYTNGQVDCDQSDTAFVGDLKITYTKSASRSLGRIQVAIFPAPENLRSIGDNLYEETEDSGPPNLAYPSSYGASAIRQRVLETSNTSVLHEKIRIYQALRKQKLLIDQLSTYERARNSSNAGNPCSYCGK